jgi:tetratricopeptide (TPR) repeat protein
LHLTGTRKERALQHGQFVHGLSAAEKKSLAFTPLSQKNQTLIKRATEHLLGAGNILSKAYEAFVLSRFFKLPAAYRDRLAPFAKSSGLSLKTIWLSLYQPDFLMLLAGFSGEKTRNQFASGMPGCSTMSIESGGHIYFLRNLDYPAAGYWEKKPAVFYHEPSEPGLQKFVSISSLGIDTAGLTGWNESGIAFSLHAHFAKKVNLDGAPIFFLGEEILENAKTLDEAINIAEKFKTIGSWALNITSFHENKSICLELSGKQVRKRESKNGILAHANDFQAPEFQKGAIHFNTAVFEDSVSRKLSLEKAAERLKDQFTWPEGFAALGSHVDAMTGELRIFGNAPSVVTTIQSIGFDPKEKCIYLSTRNETPTGLGPYLKLPFHFQDLNGNESVVPAKLHYNELFLKALHLYHEAYVSWQVKGESSDVALGLLREAASVRPDDPHLSLQLGYFELTSGSAKNAHTCFEQALQGKLTLNLEHVAHYFRGASSDLLGHRKDALRDYQAVLNHTEVDPTLANKAKRRLTEAFQTKHLKFISTDLQFAEPIDYR